MKYVPQLAQLQSAQPPIRRVVLRTSTIGRTQSQYGPAMQDQHIKWQVKRIVNANGISALASWQRTPGAPQRHPPAATPRPRRLRRAQRGAVRLPWGWIGAAECERVGPSGATRQEGLGKGGLGNAGAGQQARRQEVLSQVAQGFKVC